MRAAAGRRLVGVWLVLLAIVLGSGEWVTRAGEPWVHRYFDSPVRTELSVRRGPWHVIADVVTVLGDQPVGIALLVALCAALWRGHREVVAAAPIALFGADALTTLGKVIVRRPGPPGRIRGGPLDFAYPSGHTTTATAVLLVAALLIPAASAAQRRALVVAALVAASGVGISRIVLDVHWISDVVTGFAVSATWTAVVVRAVSRAPDVDQGSQHLAKMNG